MKTIVKITQKAILVILFGYCQIQEIKGQDFDFIPTVSSGYYFDPQNLGIISPQVSNLIKYGNLDINYYKGQLDMEIPLYTYKDQDFEIPLSIKYVSNPFIPSKRPSVVGYNWMFNVGGVITREVHGSPDDTKGKKVAILQDHVKYILDGPLVAIRNNTFKIYSMYNLANFNIDRGADNQDSYPWRADFKYDLNPDIFRFSVGKHSGSFIIGNNGTPVLLENKGYKIDISQLAVQEYSTDAIPTSSSITITTPDGFIYEFGGSTSYLEYFIPNNPKGAKVRPRYITSWFLKSIKAPSQRQVTFTYESVCHENRYKYYVRNYASGSIISNYSSVVSSPRTTPVNNDYSEEIKMKDLIYTLLIKTIKIDNVSEISFNYADRYSSFYGEDATNDKVKCLNTVSCKYNNDNIRSISFEYLNKGKYFFLQKANINTSSTQEEKYVFDYILDKDTPDPQTISLDHWGGWSGGYSTSENAQNFCTNIASRKAVNTSVCDFGLLKKVTYPTKGSTEIEYEYNRYNHWKEKDMTKLLLKDVNSASAEPCSGARIKLIKDYDPIQNEYSNIRTFEYVNPLTNKGSGVIGLKPIYGTSEQITTYYNEMFTYTDDQGKIQFVTSNTIEDVTYSIISSNSYGTDNNLSEYPIGYTDVIEKNQDNSSIHYQYSSLLDTPDDMEVTTTLEGIVYNFFPKSAVAWSPSNFTHVSSSANVTREKNYYQLLDKFKLYMPNDMSKFRGKLLNKTIYSTSHDVVLKETNTYNVNDAKSQYNISVASIVAGCVANKIYTTPCLLIQQDKTDKNGVQEQTSYTYNSHNFPSETSLFRSDGKTRTTKFKYPFEMTEGSNATVLQQMTEKNILANYVSKINYLNDKIVNGEFRKYSAIDSNNQLFKPTEIKLLRLNNPANENQLSTVRKQSFRLYILSDAYVPEDRNYAGSNFYTLDSARVQMEMSFGEYNKDMYSPFSIYTIEIKNVYTDEIVYQWEMRAVEANLYAPSYSFSDFLFADLLPGTYTFALKHRVDREFDPKEDLSNSYNASVLVDITETTPFDMNHPAIQTEIFYKYNNKGNIIESKPAGSIAATTYLWGYNHQYPIAEIKNATCDQVKNILTQALIDRVASANTPSGTDLTAINNLRSNTNLSNAQVSTYTYKPLVGMLTATDPMGIITYYEYDSFGRLKRTYLIENGIEKTIQRYDYHYQNE